MTTWQKNSFDEAFSDITAKAFKIDQSEFLHSGKFPVVDQGQNFIAGYVDDEKLVWQDDLPVVIFGDHTRILKYVDFPFVLGADGTKVLKPNKDILPLFAYYQLLSFDIPSAGYSRHFKFLKDFSFCYPPLLEQRRIADLLSRADRLRRLRRVGDSLSASLLQSVFLEMFGNPVRNEKGWDVYYLAELCESSNGIKAGPFGSSLKKEIYTKSGYRIYGQEQVIGGSFAIGDYYISQGMFEKDFKAYEVKPNDVLISLVGTFGKTIIVPEGIVPGIINPRLVKISPRKDKLNSVYLAQYLQLSPVQKQFLDLSHGGTMGILNAGQLKEFKIICPSLPEQERFSMVVRQVESLDRRQAESARQGEGLFQSLLAKSFGEGV